MPYLNFGSIKLLLRTKGGGGIDVLRFAIDLSSLGSVERSFFGITRKQILTKLRTHTLEQVPSLRNQTKISQQGVRGLKPEVENIGDREIQKRNRQKVEVER